MLLHQVFLCMNEKRRGIIQHRFITKRKAVIKSNYEGKNEYSGFEKLLISDLSMQVKILSLCIYGITFMHFFGEAKNSQLSCSVRHIAFVNVISSVVTHYICKKNSHTAGCHPVKCSVTDNSWESDQSPFGVISEPLECTKECVIEQIRT